MGPAAADAGRSAWSAVEAVAFVLIGSVEYLTRSLFWNDQVIRSNEFHTYFRVNSVFWDPNVYGRYLALVIVVATAALLWVQERRGLRAADGAGRASSGSASRQTFSQSSFIALLAGLAVLAALRWSWRWTLAAVAVGVVGAVLVVVLVGGSGKLTISTASTSTPAAAPTSSPAASTSSPNARSRATAPAPSSAPTATTATNKDVPVSVSHTEPVTVAAEQGLVGLLAYVALIVVALWTMTRASRPAGDADGSPSGASLPRPQAPVAPRRGPRCSPPSSPCWSTRWPTPGSSRTRSPGCCSRSARRWRAARGPRPRVGSAACPGYLRRLATTGAAYTAASILSKLIAVALLPLYTRYLTPADYGAAEVMFAAVVSASIVVRFGLIEALLRFYYKDDEDPDRVVASTFAGLFWFATIGGADRAALRRRRSPKRCSTRAAELRQRPNWRGSRSAASGC